MKDGINCFMDEYSGGLHDERVYAEVNDTSRRLGDMWEKEDWTPIDGAILVVKIMIWLCFQMVFVEKEFGAVFFLCT